MVEQGEYPPSPPFGIVNNCSVIKGRGAEKAFGFRNSERFSLLKQNCMGFRAREFVQFSERFGILRDRCSEVGLYNASNGSVTIGHVS